MWNVKKSVCCGGKLFFLCRCDIVWLRWKVKFDIQGCHSICREFYQKNQYVHIWSYSGLVQTSLKQTFSSDVIIQWLQNEWGLKHLVHLIIRLQHDIETAVGRAGDRIYGLSETKCLTLPFALHSHQVGLSVVPGRGKDHGHAVHGHAQRPPHGGEAVEQRQRDTDAIEGLWDKIFDMTSLTVSVPRYPTAQIQVHI